VLRAERERLALWQVLVGSDDVAALFDPSREIRIGHGGSLRSGERAAGGAGF